MKRMPIPHLVLAAVLAVILPLEQAHCAWMAIGSSPVQCSAAALIGSASAPAANSTHACCRANSASATPGSRRAAPPTLCACPQVPAGTLPAALNLASSTSAHDFLAGHIARDFTVPVSNSRETLQAPDVGSPPLPAAVGAHLLRAPPVSA
ncbi:MAG: hypothetical protein ACRENS_10005 [Candidatus Eiseniibacteriota bacterium]